MDGKISTTMRDTEMNPVNMIRMADIAMVYGRRSASLTRLSIVFLPLPLSVDESMRVRQLLPTAPF